MLGLAPEIVQEQQKKAESIYFLSGSLVHHSFHAPPGEDSSNKQHHNPFLGAAQRVLGVLLQPAVVRTHQMLKVHLEEEGLGASAFYNTSGIKVIFKIIFCLTHSWLLITKVMITPLDRSGPIFSLKVPEVSPPPTFGSCSPVHIPTTI